MSAQRKFNRQRQETVNNFWHKHERRWLSQIEGRWISQEDAIKIHNELAFQGFSIDVKDIESRYGQDLAPRSKWPLAKDRAMIVRTAVFALVGTTVPAVTDASTWVI